MIDGELNVYRTKTILYVIAFGILVLKCRTKEQSSDWDLSHIFCILKSCPLIKLEIGLCSLASRYTFRMFR